MEFGNPRMHRIIWVQRLPASNSNKSILKSIGKGIVGSSAEEKGRVTLADWKEGQVLYMNSIGGKTVGWIHETTLGTTTGTATTTANDDHESTEQEVATKSSINTTNLKSDGSVGKGPAVLYIIKVPSEHLESVSNNSETVVVESNNNDDSTVKQDHY